MKVNMIFTGTVYMVEREPKKISGLTWDWTLTFVMTGRNALSIELIKLTGEQAIVSYDVSGNRIGHPLLLKASNLKFVPSHWYLSQCRSCVMEEMFLQFICSENRVNDWINHWKRQRLVWWRRFANTRSNYSLYEEQVDLEPGLTSQTSVQVRLPSTIREGHLNEQYPCLLPSVLANNTLLHP